MWRLAGCACVLIALFAGSLAPAATAAVWRESDVHCQPCPPGSYANKSFNNNCTMMDPTRKCGAGLCPLPPKGYVGPGYQPKGGNKTVCSRCTANTYANESGMPNCVFCPAGRQPDLARTGCSACSNGEISDPRLTQGLCTSCYGVKLGYKANKEHTACEPCDPGEMSMEGVKCTPCEPGYWWRPDVKNCANKCPPGNKCIAGTSKAGKSFCQECTQCLPGTFNDEAGVYECAKCDAGEEQPLSGQQACRRCPSGYFQPRRGMPSCNRCPGGYFCPNATAAVACPKNMACPAGSIEPQSCNSMYEAKSTRCKPTMKLIAIIAGSGAAAVAVLALLTYRQFKRYSRSKRDEKTALLVREQNRRPVYTGL